MTPPRTAERLLEALGARADFRDPLLGDMDEEYMDRAERDGERAARRWYWRESLRTAPHLLYDWGRSLRARDVRRLGSVVLAGYFFTMMLVALGVAIADSITDAVGITVRATQAPAAAPIIVGMSLGVVSSLVAGYIAAWLDERAPLASAATLGLVWSVGSLVVSLLTSGAHDTPLWFRLAAPVVLMFSTTLGGVLRVRALSAPQATRDLTL